MPNFTSVGEIDVYELTCSLRLRLGAFKGENPSVLTLRGPRKDAEDPEDELRYVTYGLKKWPEASNTLSRLRRFGEGLLGDLVLGRVFIEMIEAGRWLDWRQPSEEERRFIRLYIALRTNPRVIHHSGSEGFALHPGAVIAVSRVEPVSVINMGANWCAHLVIDWRRDDSMRTEDREQSHAPADYPDAS